MGFIIWIAMGLLIGIVAKRFMPGKEPGGIMLTVCIGISGAFTGGFIANLLGIGSVTCFNPASLVLATSGSVVVLLIYRRVSAS